MKVVANLVKAFTNDPNAGNPAGVILDADSLSNEQMLKCAQELGFSESAFVQKSDIADFMVRFFAAKQEVDFCGHATIATFHTLIKNGLINFGDKNFINVKQETKAGVFSVACHKDGKIVMTQADPIFGEIEMNRSAIADLLGLSESEIEPDMPIQTVSTASPKLIVPVVSLDVLNKVAPNLQGIAEYCKTHDPKGFYVFTTETSANEADLAARFFNPTVGIDEDPATGVAAGALACYASRYMQNESKKQFVIEQGFGMNMPSTLYVDITDTVRVGGYGTSFGTRELEL